MKHTVHIGMDFKTWFYKERVQATASWEKQQFKKYSVNLSNYFGNSVKLQFFGFFLITLTGKGNIQGNTRDDNCKLTKKSNPNSSTNIPANHYYKAAVFAKQQQTTTKNPTIATPPPPPNKTYLKQALERK